MRRLRRRASKRDQKPEEAQPSEEAEQDKEENTEREEENDGNRRGTVTTREEFREHVKKSGIVGLIKRSLEERCKKEEEGDQGQ